MKDGEEVHVFNREPVAPTNDLLNPYGLNYIPEFTNIVLHRPAPEEKTKAGVVIPAHLREQHAKDKQNKDESLPFFVLAVSEQVYNTTTIRPGRWVYLASDAQGQMSNVRGRALIIANVYDVKGRAVYYEDNEVEMLYKPMEKEPAAQTVTDDNHERSL